jgi:hypothetical protein
MTAGHLRRLVDRATGMTPPGALLPRVPSLYEPVGTGAPPASRWDGDVGPASEVPAPEQFPDGRAGVRTGSAKVRPPGVDAVVLRQPVEPAPSPAVPGSAAEHPGRAVGRLATPSPVPAAGAEDAPPDGAHRAVPGRDPGAPSLEAGGRLPGAADRVRPEFVPTQGAERAGAARSRPGREAWSPAPPGAADAPAAGPGAPPPFPADSAPPAEATGAVVPHRPVPAGADPGGDVPPGTGLLPARPLEAGPRRDVPPGEWAGAARAAGLPRTHPMPAGALPVPPPLAGRQRGGGREDAAVVQVRIGRIEVRAAAPAVPAEPPGTERAEVPEPAVSLDRYLVERVRR